MDYQYDIMIGWPDAEVWAYEKTIQEEVIPLMESMNKNLFWSAITLPIIVDFIAYFTIPYIVYRILKWRGFYEKYSLFGY